MVRIVSPGMRTLAIVLWVVAVALVPLGLVTAPAATRFLAPVPSIGIAFIAWAVLWRPRIELRDDALVVVDVRRRSSYAWRRVTEVRTKYGLEFVSSEGERRTWIATRPTAALRIDDTVRGTSRRVTVEEAAAAVRLRLPEILATDGPPPTTVAAAPIAHRAHGWTVLGIIVLALVSTMAAAQL